MVPFNANTNGVEATAEAEEEEEVVCLRVYI